MFAYNKIIFVIMTSKICRMYTINSSLSLNWAPYITVKQPFVAFINDFNNATWSSRHYMTKLSNHQTLKLIKNTPFSILCGACFAPSSLKINLTISITNHNATSIPVNKNKAYKVGFNVCFMTFLITEPIKDSIHKTITCILHRGEKQIIKEMLTFTVVTRKKQQTLTNIITRLPAKLSCPSIINKYNSPAMYIWYINSNEYQFPIVWTKSNISIIQQFERNVNITCSVYNFLNPSMVLKNNFKIVGGVALKKNKNETVYLESSSFASSSIMSLSNLKDYGINEYNILFIFISIVGIIIIIFGFIIMYLFINKRLAKNKDDNNVKENIANENDNKEKEAGKKDNKFFIEIKQEEKENDDSFIGIEKEEKEEESLFFGLENYF